MHWLQNICRLKMSNKGEKATSCRDCFERGVSVSTCRLTHGHCGRGVPTSYEAIGLELDVLQCVSDLQSVTVSHSKNCVTGYVITQKRRGRNG